MSKTTARGGLIADPLEQALNRRAFGKHRRRTFREVVETDLAWLHWLRNKSNAEGSGQTVIGLILNLLADAYPYELPAEAATAKAASARSCDSAGVLLIDAERGRQVTEEGYTAEHDDTHADGSLGVMAQRLLTRVYDLVANPDDELAPGSKYRMAAREAKHVADKYNGDRVHQLTVAGAVIAAEIDRLLRAEQRESDAQQFAAT